MQLSTAATNNIQNGTRSSLLTLAALDDTNFLSTSSFYYDAPGTGLKSTQQLCVDWSKFENHTFFNSAEAKVNVAFDQIINGYPFDGTKKEVEEFLERLTGFERWVFDSFPRYRGALQFDYAQGVYISVPDRAGSLFPEIAKDRSGQTVLDPQLSSFSVEMQIKLGAAIRQHAIVCQKLDPASMCGFTIEIIDVGGSLSAQFIVSSGSANIATTATGLSQSDFTHVCFTLDRSDGVPVAKAFKSGILVDESRAAFEFGSITTAGANFLIGSGSAFKVGTTTFTPPRTLSATIDELRFFHDIRTTAQQLQYAAKGIFASPELKLYYRFNEPAPLLGAAVSDSINSIVLDSSGNSLHALVTGFTGSLRIDANTDSTNPMVYEKAAFTPVLFPAHSGVLGLNAELLHSASLYDSANPNLITRLVPPHYLLEGQDYEGLAHISGTIGNSYAGNSAPGTGKLGSAQFMLSFLYVYAKFFDEMKMFVDAFSTLRSVDYTSSSSVPDNFLDSNMRAQGFDMPPLFNDSTIEQYLDGENITQGISTNPLSLKQVRNQLMRRALVAMPDVIRSKGTQHSIKSFLRAVGIDPDNSLRIREYGGPTARRISDARESRREIGTMVPFGTATLVRSGFLSASRLEVGRPYPAGTMVQKSLQPPHGISNNPTDGLFLSGSWTFESVIKFTPTQLRSLTSMTQSLMRVMVEKTVGPPLYDVVVSNLLAISTSAGQLLRLWACPGTYGVPNPVLKLELTGVNVFDSNNWSISFGCQRGDELGSAVSSSYFIRAARSEFGTVTESHATASFFQEILPEVGNDNMLRTVVFPGGGLYASVGYEPSIAGVIGGGEDGLSDGMIDAIDTQGERWASQFNGQMANLRMWSKAVTETEWLEHVRNPRSVGVHNPLVNYNFNKTSSGSFERLRLDALNGATSPVTADGTVVFYDTSLNGCHVSGSLFDPGTPPTVTDIVDHSFISPYFDEASTDQKVRVRSLQLLSGEVPWARLAPVYEIPRGEEPVDDPRFSIEFSLIDALNRDIITMFATLDALDQALGLPELASGVDYPDLERLRDVYFNRLTGKLNFKAFFEFFRWFDDSIGTFINQLIPRKTLFKGTNFIVESHMLERAKVAYQRTDVYLTERSKIRLSDSVVQDINASCGRF